MAENAPLSLYEMGKVVWIRITDAGCEATPVQDIGGVWPIIDRISVERSISSPEVYVISGKVVSDNTAMGLGKVLIRVGEYPNIPFKVVETNRDGTFSFRLRVHEKPQPAHPAVKNFSKAYLFIGGSMDDLERTQAQNPTSSLGSILRQYPLSELQAHANKRE